MAGELKASIEQYVKSNGGQRRASSASQSQLGMLSDGYGGRFDFGKMYFFQYFTPDEPWYDTNPIVLGLGPSDDGNELGLNLHYMPYRVRIQLLDSIWSSFSRTIGMQVEGTNLGKPTRQSALTGFTWQNLKSAYGSRFNLKHCVKQYRLDRMRRPRILGYENWYVAAANDENRFHNTTIEQVQALYYNV